MLTLCQTDYCVVVLVQEWYFFQMLHIVQYVNPIIARKIEIIWLNVCSSHIFFVSLQPIDNKRHEYDEDIQYDRQMLKSIIFGGKRVSFK